MTNKQYRIYKYVVRYKQLDKVLKCCAVGDYLDLQEDAGVGALDFSDDRMDKKTRVSLNRDAMCEFEERKQKTRDVTFTRILAIWGAITGTASIAINILRQFQ